MKSAKLAKKSITRLDRFPSGVKKKGILKHETEPMVLMASDAPENMTQYTIDIPSMNKDRMLDEMDMLKNITVHLNQIVDTMEHVYTMDTEDKEEGKKEEGTLRKHEREDLVCFLIFCSQLSNQLDVALHEERQILESLLKWFEKQVQLLEELGEEEIIPESQVPVADKNITDNINKLVDRIQRLEDLKGRVQELPKYVRIPTPREKRRPLPAPSGVLKDPKNILEELAMRHATEDVMNMVQVFQDDSGAPQTIELMNNRMVEIMKIFERQTNKLHRVTNEQGVLEGKLQKIQHDFRKLAEEKEIMEDELQKMKTSDTDVNIEKSSADTRKTLLAKMEKEKTKMEEKTGAQPDKGKRSFVPKRKDSEAVKMKDDLAKAQANIQTLEREKKMLEDKLQKALQEADKGKGLFVEIPPDSPDWEVHSTALEDTEKDLSKKSKKESKPKGRASVVDGTVQKVTRFESVKSSETLPGKSQEISTAPQVKDGKGKKKGTDLSEIDRDSLHKAPSAVSEKLPKQSGKSEISSKSDARGITKPRESVDLKKRRSVVKGTGKEPHGSADRIFPPLPQDQEKQLLPVSPDQQAESAEITSEKQKKMFPTIVSSTDLQQGEDLPVTEPETADLVSSPLAEPEEFMGESEASKVNKIIERLPAAYTPEEVQAAITIAEEISTPRDHQTLTLEKAAAIPRSSPIPWADSTGLQEDVAKELVDEGMQQLVDHLTQLKGMPEAEKLTKLLIEPSKGMEALSNTQKLQLINQLIAPEGQQEEQLPISVEEGQIVDEEQREKKRRILANIASTLNLLDQTQTEAGQTEEEVNETIKMRRILLADLESNLKDLQQAEAVVPSHQDLENSINELTKKRSLLISALESNLINLKEARAIAATEPSEISQNKVKELLQDRAALTACLEANDQELQQIKSQEAVLIEKVKQEEEVNELSEKRRILLAELEKNLNDLQEAQTLAAIEPGAVNDEKIKELTVQRELLSASLDTNLQNLERAQAYVPGLREENRLKQEEINELSEKRKSLLGNLKSNLKDLQEAQALAALEPSAETDEMIKELTEQRKLLTASLETNLQDLQRAQGYVPGTGEESRLKKMELNEQSEKKRLLQERLESNLRDLQHAQMLATTEPDSVNELKLQELIEERKYLTTELEASDYTIQGIQREQEICELSQKKLLLLKNLESNLKDLREAQTLAAAEPGSITEQKLQELTEQRRHLAADLDETLHHIEELQHQDKMAKSPELGLQALSDKKELLLGKLESTLKELQQAQSLASSEAGGVNEQKIQELIEQRKQLTAELETAVFDMQEIQLRDEILKSGEKEVHSLLEKKQLLLQNLVSTVKELQEAQAAEAAQPGSVSADKLQVLREKGRGLATDLEVIVHDIKKAQHRASGRAELVTSGEQELYDLPEKKQFLLQNLTSNLKELEEVQALAGSEPDSFTENEIEQLNAQRKLLSANLDTIIQQIKETENRRVSEIPKIPVGFKKDLNELSEHKKLFLEFLESNLKDLQEALADTYPGSMTEQKIQELIEVRRLLASGLKTIMEEIEDVESQAVEKDAITKTREIILEELYQKQRLILENLDSNQKDLQQAEALAAAQPGGMEDEKIKELTEQRRLLASGLEGIMQDIQEAEGLDRDKLELLEILEGGLAELSEFRTQLWKNVEINLNDLKDLQALSLSELDGMQEEEKQTLAEHISRLTSSLEALLQDMEEAQNLVLSGGQITTDERNLNDLFEIKRLESKLDEVREIGGLSDIQLDSMKEKLCELKTKRGLDKWDRSLQGPLSLTKEELAISGLDDEAARRLLRGKRTLSPYLQKNIKDVQKKIIRDLQQKSMLLQGDISDTELYKQTEDKSSLEKCLVSMPLKILEDATIIRYGPDDEQLAKRRALVAKLEANMKALQDLHEEQQMRKTQAEKLSSRTTPELLKGKKSGLQSYLGKALEVKKITPWRDTEVPTDQEEGTETSIQLVPNKLQKKDMGLELKNYFMQHLKKTAVPYELSFPTREMQERLDSSKSLLSAQKASLPQVFVLPQSQLQQANLVAAQKLLYSQPTLSTARFHDYSQQPPRSAWAGNQLPVTNYLQKLMTLKKKLLNPELKGLLDASSAPLAQASKPDATDSTMDSMLICGKGFRRARQASQLRNN